VTSGPSTSAGASFQYATAPQRIVFGVGTLDRLADEIDAGGWTRTLLVTSPHYARAGVVDALATLLGDRLVASFTATAPHVPAAHVDTAIGLAQHHGAQAVIALGGGSPVGLAKAVAHARTSASPEMPTVSVAIPTTYSGSEMTPVFGVTRPQPDGSTRKVTVRDPRVPPRVVVYDPRLTCTLPPDLTASTGVNALAHGIEATYSRTRHPLSMAAALASIARIAHALPTCVLSGHDLAARTAMLEGAHLGGVALATVDMGLHHGTGHVLGGTAGVPHGVANCIVLPQAVRFNADACAAPLALVADAMGVPRAGRSDEAVAHALADHLQTFIAQLGQPQRLREVGVAHEQLDLLADALLASAAVANNPKPIGTREAAYRYLEAMW
jgi:alcohol dehydrogenase class IV